MSETLTMSAGDCDINSVLINKHLNSLESEDRAKRKSALQSIQKYVFDEEDRTVEELSRVFDVLAKPLITCFNDQAESCRELAGNITHEFFKKLTPDEKHLVYLIPTLVRRLGSPERVEPSEEVRLVLVCLLRDVVNRYASFLPSYLNDIITILAKVVLDPYPRIKKESCECTSDLAKAIPRHFHLQSESMVKPILQNFSHQQFRIRVASISAIGDVVRYGNNKSVADVIVPLAERLFDQSPIVRLAVTKVVGDWMVNLPDRYSYFSRMLPVMLTSLNDQDANIQKEAWELWDKAGTQWLEENENDVKDKLDFLNGPPDHYPPNVLRPNLGCRTLVKRHLHHIAPALVREMEDWLVDVRIKASQLLCILVVNVEKDVAQYLEQLLAEMYRASCDTEQRVVDNVERAAELLGYFAPPANFWSLMKPVMENSCHKGHLRVLANLMTGCNKDLSNTAPDIVDFLHLPSTCHSKECVYQMQIVRCCCALLKTCGADCLPFAQQLFDILVSVGSVATSEAVHKKVEDGLCQLEDITEMGSRAGLYISFTHNLLEDVTASPDSWTVHSPQRFIFQHILLNAGPAINPDLEVVLKTLKIALSPDNPDAELKLKLMTTLATLLQSKPRQWPWTPQLLENYLRPLVEDVLAPSLVWKAGRSAEALRTISIACLLSALQETEKEDPKFVASLLDKLLAVLLGLVEDPARKTRLFTCQCLAILIETAQEANSLTAEHIHKSYFVVLKRLDDVADDVRSCAVGVLRLMFASLPEDYSIQTSFSHIEALFATMLIHLDDPEESFRALVLDALKDLSWLKPSFLHERLSATHSQFRNQDGCQQLLDHVATKLSNE